MAGRRTRRTAVGAVAVALALAAAGTVPAAQALPGDLDPPGGSCGLAFGADLGAQGSSTDAVTREDDVFVVGSARAVLEPAASRLSASALTDSGVGLDTYTHPTASQGTSAVLQPATTPTRLLVGGTVGDVAAIVGLNLSNLEPASTWGTAGVSSLTGATPVADLAVDSTGRTYAVAGDQIYRLTSTGALDSTWASDGSATATFRVTQVAVGDDGIWVAGEDTSSTPSTSWKLQRFTTLGLADPTFNSAAPVTTTFTAPAGKTLVQLIAAELVLKGGKPVIGGSAIFETSTEGADSSDFVFAQYDTTGALDASFGDGGRALIDAARFETLESLLVDSVGRLIAAGGGYALGGASGEDAVFARILAAGQLDTSFGFGSEAARHDLGGDERAVGLGLHDGGALVMAGLHISAGTEVVPAAIGVQTEDEIPAAWTLEGFGGLDPVAVGNRRHPACVEDGPDFGFDIARDAILVGDSRSGLLLDGFGGLHGFGPGQVDPPAPASGPYFGWDIARAIELRDDEGGYVLDGYGGLHRVSVGGGTAPASPQGPYFGWDIARDVVFLPGGTGGYVLDGFGGIHPFSVGANPKPPAVTHGPYFGWDIARQIVLNDAGTGGYLLDGYGGLHRFAVGTGALPPEVSGGPYFGWDIARDFVLRGGSGGYVLDGYGGIHGVVLGGAVEGPPGMQGPYYGVDVARGLLLLLPPPPE